MRHLFIDGKPGVGKSTLLRNMILSDLCFGVGLTLIDPDGELIEEDILPYIPRWRAKDVIYLNPARTDKVLGLNVVESLGDKDKNALMVSNVMSIFKHIWSESWGPRLEDLLRNSLFVLIEQPEPVSLACLPRLLQDRPYRKQLLEHVTNPVVRNFFERDYESWEKTRELQQAAIAPVLNKVRAF